MGKWSSLKKSNRFEPLPEDPKRWEVLRKIVDGLRGSSLQSLAESLNGFEARKSELNAELKEVNLKIDAHERALAQLMESQGLESVVVAGYRWTPSPEPYAQVADPVAFNAWVREHMPDALSLNEKIRQSLVKKAIEKNEALPPGLDVYMKESFSRTVNKG